MSLKWNMSFSFGFTESADESLGLVAGFDDVFKSPATLLTTETQIPLGSATKPWTAVQVLQHMEAGRISLDDLASTWVDPLLSRLYGSSLVTLFGQNATKVTIRDLLAMTSGFSDYLDSKMEFLTLIRAGDDVDPFQYLVSAARQGNVCEVGKCAYYSGANYVLLGYVLTELQGLWHWQDLDQRAVIPAHLRHRYAHTSFLAQGRCAQYPGVAHQWAEVNHPIIPGPHWPHPHRPPSPGPGPRPGPPSPPHPKPRPNVSNVDLLYSSCLNGWTMGNIASTGADMANFFYDLFTGKGFINDTTVAMMQPKIPLTNDWCPGCLYGFGLMANLSGQDQWDLQTPGVDENGALLLGHLGADWGSGSWPCGFNQERNFSVCFNFNSLEGMNCSTVKSNKYAIFETTCLAYDAVLGVVGGPRLDCSIPKKNDTDPATCAWIKRDPANHMPPPHGPWGPHPPGPGPASVFQSLRRSAIATTPAEIII
eukprot:TRINITY_DN121750_c0_g1_i1.p1 TRINITY_DN121750_c0_g1~~TRINITY_DN121750_c0_g1_i1.p1  ORF type:complete len:540 (-),score=88.89 TRINITY_DN121750_c0_g1_i1:253-1692(-)